MKLLILVFALGLFASCSSVQVEMQANSFLTPRTSGKLWSGEANLGAGPSMKYTLITDASTTPPNSTTDVRAGSVLSAFTTYLALGLGSWIDLSITGGNTGVKAQLLGSPAAEGMQMSLMANTGGRTTNLGSSSSTVTAKAKTNEVNVGASLGYRMKDGMTPYASFTRKDFKAETEVTQTSGVYNYSSSGNQMTSALGFIKEFGGFVLIAELISVEANLTAATTGRNNGYGVMMGYHW